MILEILCLIAVLILVNSISKRKQGTLIKKLCANQSVFTAVKIKQGF